MKDFGFALAALKQGEAVARSGWNGAGQFVYRVGPGRYPPATVIAKRAFGGEAVPYAPYYALKNAQGSVVPWTPSQGDLEAEDWTIVNVGVNAPTAEAPPWHVDDEVEPATGRIGD